MLHLSMEAELELDSDSLYSRKAPWIPTILIVKFLKPRFIRSLVDLLVTLGDSCVELLIYCKDVTPSPVFVEWSFTYICSLYKLGLEFVTNSVIAVTNGWTNWSLEIPLI